jgi:fucose permease
MGGGLTVLQAATNPYATILGPIETAARRISIMGVCNKFAGVIGIYTIYKALFSGLNEELKMLQEGNLSNDAAEAIRQHLAEQVILPYIIITAVFILLVVFIKLAKLPRIENTDNGNDSQTTPLFSRKYTYLWLGVLAIFFYVGAEVVAIDYLIPYGNSFGISKEISKDFPTYAMFALIVGYFVGLLTVPKMISQRHALITHLIIAIFLAYIAIYSQSLVHVFKPGLDPMSAQNLSVRLSLACLIMLSFTHAIMWPAIWPLSIHDLGKHTELASGLLVMACAGGGVMSLIYGKLCELPQIGHQKAYLILFVCYIYILFFATYGYKMNGNKRDKSKE